MSQIAALFARLGFQVDAKGLDEFEKKLTQATKNIQAQGAAAQKANQGVERSAEKARKSQNALAREIRSNYSKVRTDRRRAEADLVRINDAITKGGLPDSQVRELQEARGRTQQRLNDLVAREKAAQEAIRKNAERERQKAERQRVREHKRQVAERQRAEKRLERETVARRRMMERRDEQAHRLRTEKANEASRIEAAQARMERQRQREQVANERRLHREQLRQRAVMERRDYESWRMRGEQLRQARLQEHRYHQQRMREATQYGRMGRPTALGSYRGVREQARAWIPGIGGAFAAQRSTQSYQSYVAMEQGLTAGTGSREQGLEEMRYLISLAQELGVFVGDLGSDYAKFAASTVGTTVTLEQQRDIFKGVSAMVRVLNMSADEAKGTFRALSQMMSNGQIMAQELQLQLGDRMPGAIQAMARAAEKAGVISPKAGEEPVRLMKDAMAKGLLRSEKILPYFGEELWELANRGNALANAMNSTSAAIGRFRTNVWLANKLLNESGYDKTVRKIFNTTSDSLKEAEPAWELLGKSTEHLGRALRAPIELFGTLSTKLGRFTEDGYQASAQLKLMAAAVVAAFGPLRKLFIALFVIPFAISAIDDTLRNGASGWDDFFVKLIAWSAAAVALARAMASVRRSVGGLKRGLFGTVTGAGGSAGGAAAGRIALASLLSGVVLKVALISIAAGLLHELANGFLGDPNRSLRENLIDFGRDRMERNREMLSDPNRESVVGRWWRGLQDRDQERRASFRQITDRNINDYLNSTAPSNQTNTFDIDIHVESSDPERAGVVVRDALEQYINDEYRNASSAQQAQER